MKASEAREFTFSIGPKRQAIATPFWSKKDDQGNEIGLDGCVSLIDLPANDLEALQTSLKGRPMLLTAAVLVRAVNVTDRDDPESRPERMYQDTDRDMVAGLGSTVLLPLMEDVGTFFGLNSSTVAQAIKNAS